jgi:hypothetical protein
VRELRALVAHRARLVGQRTQATNRLHSVLLSHNLAPPEAEAGWATLPLTPLEALRVQQDRQVVASLTTLIHSVDGELTTLSVLDPWAGPMSYVLPLSGVGIITGMTILAAIGEITRFPWSGQTGEAAAAWEPVCMPGGQTFQTGKMTKQGRRELRTALIEVAWSAVRHDPVWKARFESLASKKGAGKAIVAMARKLLVVIWHVLTHQGADRQADPVRIIRKLWRVGHLGRTRHQFRIQPYGVCARPPRSVGSGVIHPDLRIWRTPLHVTCFPFTDRLGCSPPTSTHDPFSPQSKGNGSVCLPPRGSGTTEHRLVLFPLPLDPLALSRASRFRTLRCDQGPAP